ncbi:MAG: hypothetical protein M9894_21415 [Planctomycetes bacterium]|nr:hypothetical protein [Planctomycetota bacterium]
MWNRRPDGALVTDAAPYRQAMPLIMPGRNEAAVYFDLEVDLARTEPFLDDWNRAHPEARATLFHLVLWAAARVLQRRPELNRFVAGGRLWQRDGVWFSFAAKERLDDGAPLKTLKRRFDGLSFPEVVARVRGDVRVERSGQESATERELRLLMKLPVLLRRLLYGLFRWLDALGLAPRGFIDGDPLYTSMFVANLGSLKMAPCYHHLYEHGTGSLFCVVGRAHEGKATLRFTMDERVTDGLYAHRSLELLRELLEDPAAALGQTAMAATGAVGADGDGAGSWASSQRSTSGKTTPGA